eukprot:TRINITY_DN4552_c0_g2_i1.p1 TRINITY_DN4552_c0_g2~~TRINITY_DN4552_c0_g2_i1.p1  ORF type:complete len:656 (-),score=52.63 TRINITY_DN4552_c0_g2_i1:374-2278(-)
MSSSFQLWLHPLHGNIEKGLRPLCLEELQMAESVARRVALLTDAAMAVADLPETSRVSSLLEVRMNDLGLYVLNHTAQRRLWLPLPLSQIGELSDFENVATSAAGIVGVLAYGYPIESPGLSWGKAHTALASASENDVSNVWTLLVTRRRTDRRVPSARDAESGKRVLEVALDALGRRGAIRGTLSSFKLTSETLGEGSCATVCRIERRQQGNSEGHIVSKVAGASSSFAESSLAAKVMIASASDQDVLIETSYLLAAQCHSNIVNFVGLFCSYSNLETPVWTMIMEAHPEGNLRSKVHYNGRLSMHDALKSMEHLLLALVHIHEVGIIHRDVKPENVLLAYDGRAVLVDFGVSVHVSETERMLGRCGSPGWVAPEILKHHKYAPKSDVFSCGAVLYYVLGTVMPFQGSDLLSTLRTNARARVRFPDEYFSEVSLDCQSIVRLLLQALPSRRPDSRAALDTVVSAHTNANGIVLPGVVQNDGDDATSVNDDRSSLASLADFESDLSEYGCVGDAASLSSAVRNAPSLSSAVHQADTLRKAQDQPIKAASHEAGSPDKQVRGKPLIAVAAQDTSDEEGDDEGRARQAPMDGSKPGRARMVPTPGEVRNNGTFFTYARQLLHQRYASGEVVRFESD